MRTWPYSSSKRSGFRALEPTWYQAGSPTGGGVAATATSAPTTTSTGTTSMEASGAAGKSGSCPWP